MYNGIAFALGACFIWALVFVVPQFIEGFSSIEFALGCYLFFGLVSSCILLKRRLQGACRYSLSIWTKALYFSLMSTIVYYTSVVFALRYSSPAICALILGISPITIAFYGNWKQKECSFKTLVLPSILILVGLVLINAPHFSASESPVSYTIGLLWTLVALIAWSWFVVANSEFLKDNPEIASSDWATLIGVATLFWAAACSIILWVFFEGQLHLYKYVTPGPELTRFIIGSAIIGLLCSWLGAFLWNRATYYLPVSLAGQLTIFETIFGVLFVYVIDQHVPPQIEFFGIALLLSAIVYGIRSTSQVLPQISN